MVLLWLLLKEDIEDLLAWILRSPFASVRAQLASSAAGASICTRSRVFIEAPSKLPGKEVNRTAAGAKSGQQM